MVSVNSVRMSIRTVSANVGVDKDNRWRDTRKPQNPLIDCLLKF